MPVENAAQRVWLRLHMSQAVPAMGELGVFKKLWVKVLKKYDSKIGIKRIWQSLDSISVKSPLGGR
jgi:hypothetical protein